MDLVALDMKRYKTTLGTYTPSAFVMEVNTTSDDINLKEIMELIPLPSDHSRISQGKKQNAATFLHEYAHFLQDFGTTVGLVNMIHIGDLVRD